MGMYIRRSDRVVNQKRCTRDRNIGRNGISKINGCRFAYFLERGGRYVAERNREGSSDERRSQVGKPHNSKLGRHRSSVTLLIHIWKVGRRWEEKRRWRKEGRKEGLCSTFGWVEDGGGRVGGVSGRADSLGGRKEGKRGLS